MCNPGFRQEKGLITDFTKQSAAISGQKKEPFQALKKNRRNANVHFYCSTARVKAP
jgi:hypothetical protein